MTCAWWGASWRRVGAGRVDPQGGEPVRITAQLVDAKTGGHLWADRYDRELTDIFEVQDEVTLQIVGALKVTLRPAERARVVGGGHAQPCAHDFMLRAREVQVDLLRGTVDGGEKLGQALRMLVEAKSRLIRTMRCLMPIPQCFTRWNSTMAG